MSSKRRRGRGRRAAVSLLEVMVAVGVFAGLALAVFSALHYAGRAEVLAREHLAASEAAGRELDLLMARPDFDAIAGVARAFAVPQPSGVGTLPPASAGYFPRATDDASTPEDEAEMAGHLSTTLDPDGDGSARLLEVRVTVAWRSADGSDQRVDLVTRRAR